MPGGAAAEEDQPAPLAQGAEIEAVKGDKTALASEAADVLFHLLVMLHSNGVALADVMDVLEKRQGKSGIAEKAER